MLNQFASHHFTFSFGIFFSLLSRFIYSFYGFFQLASEMYWINDLVSVLPIVVESGGIADEKKTGRCARWPVDVVVLI